MQKIIIGREYPQIVQPLIEQAQHSIDILVFDWRWYPSEPTSTIQKFNQQLLIANGRGVKLRALVNNNIMPTILHLQGLQVKRVNTRSLMHVKMIIIDGKYLVLGSHNLTKRAFCINHEVSILTDNEESIKRLLNYFENLCRL